MKLRTLIGSCLLVGFTVTCLQYGYTMLRLLDCYTMPDEAPRRLNGLPASMQDCPAYGNASLLTVPVSSIASATGDSSNQGFLPLILAVAGGALFWGAVTALFVALFKRGAA